MRRWADSSSQARTSTPWRWRATSSSRPAPRRSAKAVLPAIAGGRCIISLAALEADGAFGPRSVTVPAERRSDGFTISGTKLLVANAQSADWFLVPVRTSGSATSGNGILAAGRPTAEHGISDPACRRPLARDHLVPDAQYRRPTAPRRHVR